MSDDISNIISSLISPTRKSRHALGLHDILVYSPTGLGKSPLASSAINCKYTNKPLYIDLEEGADAADTSGIPTIDVRKYAVENKAISEYNALLKVIEDINKVINSENDYTKLPWNCIIVDGFTEIYQIILDSIIREGVGKSGNHDPELANQNDRGRAMKRIRDVVRDFKSMPFNLIFTAREYPLEDSDTRGKNAANLNRTFKAIPHLTEGASRVLVSEVDLIGRLRRNGVKLRLVFKGTSAQETRDRSNLLPDYIDTPTIKEIWSYLKGDKVKNT